MQIFLIRHPQPVLEPSVCYGRTDILLHPKTLLNLQTMALSLREQLPDTIPFFSSPLLRCRALAEKLHTQAMFDNRLMEMDFGEWEMQPWSNIPRQQLDAWAKDPLHYVIPGGESVAQLQMRVLSFVQEQQAQGTKNMAIVTHAGVIKILTGVIQRLDDAEWMGLHFDYGSLQVVHFP